ADITVDEIIPEIRKFFPGINKDSINFFYHGTYNVFDINNKYILRVADRAFRNSIGLDMLKKESEVIDFLRDKLPLPIPKLLHINESSLIPFSIHEKIPGKSLVFVIDDFTIDQKVKIGTKVGKFLSVLHSKELVDKYMNYFPKEKQSDDDFNHFYRAKWTSRFQEAKDIAYQYLNQQQQKWLTKIFEEFLENDNNFTFSPRITHCDFDTSNILVDPNNHQVTGIIDFENCKIWDPAADLLFYNEGPEFMKAVLDNYLFSDDNSLPSRMKFNYSRTCCAYLIWGSKHNRSGMIEEGKKIIKNNMKTFP
ncbi:MAG: aminoglycoside phosphotransferase family protein, partial [Asgard group archaeon]|nr:aminoglycoside phosphotransferase family protein [Asgard group archaeon]